MGNKTVSLKPETYRRLESAKGEVESFNEVVERLLEAEDHSLLRLVGLIDDEAVAELRVHSQAFRERANHR